MNTIDTMAGKRAVQEFQSLLPHVISSKGFWPLPMIAVVNGNSQNVALRCSDEKALESFLTACQHPDTVAAIMGFDGNSDPEEMGTEMTDVLGVVLYEAANRVFTNIADIRPRSRFRYGIIEYCFKPRVIRRINWENHRWNRQLECVIHSRVPDTTYSGEILMPKAGSIVLQ